jgi:hypothetical protein
MAKGLLLLTVGLLEAGILMELLGAPYRLVQGVVILGAVTLILQVPDTVDRWRRVREQERRKPRG